MNEKDAWCPAFPLKEPLTNDWPGMTLRDYFAAKAMQGLLTNEAMPFDTKGQTLKDFLARAAYDYADAMLEARK